MWEKAASLFSQAQIKALRHEYNGPRKLRSHQRLIPDSVRPRRLLTKALDFVVLVLVIVPFEEIHAGIALEGQNVRRDAVEEPAIVANDQDRSGKFAQGVLER